MFRPYLSHTGRVRGGRGLLSRIEVTSDSGITFQSVMFSCASSIKTTASRSDDASNFINISTTSGAFDPARLGNDDTDMKR
jgi:hypothetical protein